MSKFTHTCYFTHYMHEGLISKYHRALQNAIRVIVIIIIWHHNIWNQHTPCIHTTLEALKILHFSRAYFVCACGRKYRHRQTWTTVNFTRTTYSTELGSNSHLTENSRATQIQQVGSPCTLWGGTCTRCCGCSCKQGRIRSHEKCCNLNSQEQMYQKIQTLFKPCGIHNICEHIK